MNIEKTYQCLCGQEFTTPNKFNAHKRNCEIHLRNKYGDEYEEFIESWKRNITRNSGKKQHTEALERKQLELNLWISEKHTCEKCGILMTKKFGPGRFCSRKCSNSRTFSEEAIKKKSNTAQLNAYKKFGQLNKAQLASYIDNPKYCVICNKPLSFELRNRQTCSEECLRALHSKRSRENPHPGGYREGSGVGKHGYYKGYKCDSTYELAYVIYNIDHNILFERSSNTYPYVAIDDSVHTYYPDFIQDGFIIEIKGYMNENVYRKIAAVNDYPVKLLSYPDIKPMIDYVQTTYNVKDISELYE